MQAMSFGGMQLQLLNAAEGWLKIEDTDLTGVSRLMVMVGWQEPPSIGYTMELRAGAPDGEVLGTGQLNPAGLGGQGGAIMIPIKKTDGVQPELYLTYKAEGEGASPFALTQVQFN